MARTEPLVLGGLEYPIGEGPAEISADDKWIYPTHPRIQGQETMQSLGAKDLSKLRVVLQLNREQKAGPVEKRYRKLREVADQHKPIQLLFGDGLWDGLYVIESISFKTQNSDPTGQLISARLEVQLKGSTNPDETIAIAESGIDTTSLSPFTTPIELGAAVGAILQELTGG